MTTSRTTSQTTSPTITAGYARFVCNKFGNFVVPGHSVCSGQVDLVNKLLAVCYKRGNNKGASPKLSCSKSAPFTVLDESQNSLGLQLLTLMFQNFMIGKKIDLELQVGSTIAVKPAVVCSIAAAVLNTAVNSYLADGSFNDCLESTPTTTPSTTPTSSPTSSPTTSQVTHTHTHTHTPQWWVHRLPRDRQTRTDQMDSDRDSETKET